LDAFGYCVQFVLGLEGGESNDATDPGGHTRYGIASATHGSVKDLTLEQAVGIYRREYWDRCQCGRMPVGLALLVFDGAVNQGQERASTWLQLALGVSADGVIGERTLAALGSADLERVVRLVAGLRALAYMQTPQEQRARYLGGWRNRLVRVYLEALLLLRAAPSVVL
jgi:lysozyme family protein